MLFDAIDYRSAIMIGRFIITTIYESEPWEVAVEPEELTQLLVVVTAYQVKSP